MLGLAATAEADPVFDISNSPRMGAGTKALIERGNIRCSSPSWGCSMDKSYVTKFVEKTQRNHRALAVCVTDPVTLRDTDGSGEISEIEMKRIFGFSR